ncbi:unnamed protein product [Phytophthora fragariaefolia]|uniref:Unnamed protein product n=1 Tax=Phytophthora fragariaefolia TaxID=1490495 RepID=A0A9W6TIK1_9STRA|nr:unnamed protein product [Phytophthora fragariaefolia]
MARAAEAAREALEPYQRRCAKHYDRQDRHVREFAPEILVWVLKRPQGKGITKLAHQWVGPARITQDAGYNNWEVVRDDEGERLITHSSFLVSSWCPSESLGTVAEWILAELAQEEGDDAELEMVEYAEEVVRTGETNESQPSSSGVEARAERIEQGTERISQRSNRSDGRLETGGSKRGASPAK